MLADPFHRTIWELLRRLNRAATPEELASLTGAPEETTKATVGRLQALGLVQPAFERGTRKKRAFRITRDRLMVVYDRADEEQMRAAAEIRARVAEHGRGVLETARVQASLHEEPPIEVHRSVHLRHEEYVELRRRIQAVSDFVDALESASRGRPHVCNYHLAIEVRPLRSLVLPTATLHLVDTVAHRHPPKAPGTEGGHRPGPSGRGRVLSEREREIGELLAAGRSCPEIAENLGVSVNTVRTITKRLYAKVGVRRRAELVNFLRGPTI